MLKRDYPVGSERKFNEFLVSEYLKHGSVDEVFREHRWSLPISYAGYHRVLDNWGILKAAGPNSKLAETVDFITRLVYERVPLEKLYRKMPPSFKTSAATLYRILAYVKEGITRRLATGLIVTPTQKDDLVLLAKDYSLPRVNLGKPYGSITIPMTFSKKTDPREEAILRVLQQEVFTDLAIKKKDLRGLVPSYPKPFMYLDIVDVRVEIFHLTLPEKYAGIPFSSFRLKEFKFVKVKDVLANKPEKLRLGVSEALKGYSMFKKLKDRNLSVNPIQRIAPVNVKLLVSEES